MNSGYYTATSPSAFGDSVSEAQCENIREDKQLPLLLSAHKLTRIRGPLGRMRGPPKPPIAYNAQY